VEAILALVFLYIIHVGSAYYHLIVLLKSQTSLLVGYHREAWHALQKNSLFFG